MTKVMKRKRLSNPDVPEVVEIKRLVYPDRRVLELAVGDLEDILRGDSIASRLPELGRAVCETHCVLAELKFGNPDVSGSCAHPDPALIPKLQAVDRLLMTCKDRLRGSYSPQRAVVGVTSMNGLDDLNEMMVVLDCSVRILRQLLAACVRTRNTGCQDMTN